ncbi:MAG: PAS domain S-box protein [Deltaproteobacteria bacterium]|nr:PAS domain S-box protein [Deltaproteobacteria bacterium]
MKHYDKEIVRTSDRQLTEILTINKELTEKSLRMRCLSYLAEVKSELLTQTVYEIGRSKKILQQINLDLTSSHTTLKHQQEIVRAQNEELERCVAERVADLQHSNKTLREEIEAHRKSEKQLLLFRTLLNHSNDEIFVIDPERGTFLDVNEKTCTELGYSRVELLSRSVIDVEQTIPDLAAWQTHVKELAHMGTALFPGIHIRKDGTTFPVEVSASYIREEDTAYLVAVARNITDRKKLEAQFLQSQKMEAIGRFAGGIAHDFNNLLTAIIGYSEMLLLDRTPKSGDYDEIKTIRETAERASQLTRRILAFSKRPVMEPTLFNLNDILRDMEKMLTRLLGEDIEFRFEPDADLRTIKADPGQVEQVLLNLVVNARDAMPDGGRLTVATTNIRLDPSYVQAHPEIRTGDYVLLSVTDTGIGMEEEVRTHIFDPYFTTKEDGTGLGLSTVYGIVRQNGGHLYVYSEIEQGTTFKVYFPVATQGGVTKEVLQKEETSLPHGRETLLVVEDEQTIITLVLQVLESLDYNVRTAMSGEEALRLIAERDRPPDLLITDVILTGIGGPEMAVEMKKKWADLKVLFMSGYADRRIAKLSELPEPMAFLPKPFTPGELARKVREILDG